MHIVIEISDEMYDWVNDPNKFFNKYGVSDFCDLVKNGTPLPEKHGDIIDRGFMVAKLLDEILFDRVKTPMDCLDFIKNYKITVPATEGFTPYFCQNRLPEKEKTDADSD